MYMKECDSFEKQVNDRIQKIGYKNNYFLQSLASARGNKDSPTLVVAPINSSCHRTIIKNCSFNKI